jgi:KDO2-lipid IV(A) lauroyltransferase
MWELVPHIVTRALSPGARARSVIVYRPLHNRTIDRLVLGWRQRCGIELLPARGSWPRLVEALRAGGVVGLAADQRPHGDRVLRAFLGERVPFEDGLGRLHALTGAPTWFVAVVWQGVVWRSHWVELSDSQRPPSDKGDVHDGDAVMERYAQALSDCVRQWPEQYLWSHRRWRDDTACLRTSEERE